MGTENRGGKRPGVGRPRKDNATTKTIAFVCTEEEAKYRLEQIQKLLLAIWAIEDRHNGEYSGSVKEIVNVCNDKIDALLGVEHD